MSTPTPSDFARHLTQRKQHEIEREQQIADLEKKLAKSSSEKHDRTVRKNRARFGSGKAKEQDASTTQRSSRKGAVKGTSSKSEQTARTSTLTTSSTKQSTPPKKQDSGTETVKKPFVRKPHLTQRLSDNEALLELQKSFPKTKHHNRSAKSTRSSSKRK